MASDYGHHRCVRILLKNGADVKASDADGNNCLMRAIERNHRETVLTILSDGQLGPKSLTFTRVTVESYVWKHVTIEEHIQPMTMLITQMPDIAEWVLNKCALANNPPGSTDQTDDDGGTEEQRLSIEAEELQGVSDYVMEDKFVILEPPATNNGIVTGVTTTRNRWFRHVHVNRVSRPHPIETMVDHDRTDMLNHTLVQTWINTKLNNAIPELIIYMLLYLLFLANLTIFSLLLPRPGPWNEYCVPVVNTTSVEGNNTESFSGLKGTCRGQSKHLTNFFYVDAVVLILTAIIYLLFEVAQLYNRLQRYLLEVENYIQVVMYFSVIIFVFPVGQNSCWCLPGWKWQIGALAVFFAWINLLLLIRYLPWWKIGERSTMLFNVYSNFVQSLYLPIILVLTFAIPMYMIFVDTMPTEGGEAPTILATFATPYTTLHKVIFQSAGEVGSDNFIEAPFHYQVAGVVLFLLFIVAIPVLFNNFLIGMAVGETEEERNKASLSLTKRKIYYIFETQNILYRKIIPACTGIFRGVPKKICLDAPVEKRQEFRAKDKAIKDDIKSKARAKYTKRNVKRLKALMTQNQSTITLHKVELEKSLQSLGGEVADMRTEMAEIKESIMAMEALITKHFE